MIDTSAILRAVNLSDLIERDTDPSKIKGRFFCPFCQTAKRSTPALSVHGQSWKCFGCGAGGDAIDYIMARDNVKFIEACKRLGWDGVEPDPIEMGRRLAENEQRKVADTARRAAELDALLAEYSAEEIWQAYSRRMTDEHRAWWDGRGVPREWQDYLRLGYIPDKVYRGKDDTLQHSPAYTIPYFHQGFSFQNMQYRLHNPERPQDRYRFENGLRATYYQVEPDNPIGEWAIICEGAIKAMVSHIYGDTPGVSLLAVPNQTALSCVVEAVKDCRKVWVVLDPDCWHKPANAPQNWRPAPVKLAGLIGKAALIVRLPAKVDDALLDGSLTVSAWKRAMRDARTL